MRDTKGTLYVYMVLAGIILVGMFMWFFFATALEQVQVTITPYLNSTYWLSSTHYLYFVYANNFITYFWMFLFTLLIIIAAYWVWIYSQHKQEAYM